jgi:hypothetical protein
MSRGQTVVISIERAFRSIHSGERMSKRHRNHFSPEEDTRLTNLVLRHGQDWSVIGQSMPGRTARQCRERWRQCISPDVNHSSFTEQEEELLMGLVSSYGTKWKRFESSFRGRPDNQLKCHHRVLMRRSLSRQTTHGSESPSFNDSTRDDWNDELLELDID